MGKFQPLRWRPHACLIATMLFGICLSLSSRIVQATQSGITGVLPNAAEPLITPTYDGSGQATEPSIRYFPHSWNGYNYWLVINPYPNSDASKENPSILVSNDVMHWSVPPGLSNPIALPANGHLADGELYYDSHSNQLWVYYIWEGPHGLTHVLRKASPNGVDWGPARDVLVVSYDSLLSPTIAQMAIRHLMIAPGYDRSSHLGVRATIRM